MRLPDSAQRRTVTYRRVIRPRGGRCASKENEMIIAAHPRTGGPRRPAGGTERERRRLG